MEQQFFVLNRQEILNSMADHSVLVLFSGTAPHKSADAFYHYTAQRNFFYLTGLGREQMTLVLSKRGGQTSETLFIEKADPVMEKWVGKRMTAEEVRAVSGVEAVDYLDNFTNRLNRLLLDGTYQHLYLNLEQRGWETVQSKAHAFGQEMQQRYPYLSLENIYPVICAQRTIKSVEEIERMKQAIAVTNEGIRNMMTHARPGVMEYELEAHFNYVLNSNGIKEHAFPSIIAGGGRATVLHYEDNDQQVQDGDLVLIDLGAQYKYYNADISRTFPVNGKFSDRQKEIYEIVLEAELETIKAIKPGVPHAQLNEITKRVLADGLKRIGKIEADEELVQYYYHGVSHYLGLDTHDVGEYGVLQPGMVVTVEPGLYIADESIGIRIEDDVLVTEDGYEVLSKDILKTVEDIEAFMANRK